jgi:hypothetical protein
LPQLLIAGLLAILLLWPGVAAAAELRQVLSARRLQIGDGNRSYGVELVCLEVDPARAEAAAAWLRKQVPRGTRVNLRPMGAHNGILQARVLPLTPDSTDLASGLIEAQLATASPCPA